MAKRKRYDDEFRAGAVLMLQAAGYPEKEGSLTAVSKNTKVPLSTLSRWFRGTSNPPPSNIVNNKKGTILEKLDVLTHMILDSFDLDTVTDAQLRERMTSLGIVIDKGQLLRGEPTERVENLTTEQRRDRVAELFEKARARRTSDAS